MKKVLINFIQETIAGLLMFAMVFGAVLLGMQ